METQIKSFYRTSKGIKFVSLFGYATKGVPSLEVHGVGKLSRNMKEKMIFLSRNRQLTIPLRRYVLCVDGNELTELKAEDLKWLEFPLLLLYWHMAGLVPISTLEDCLCSGWIKTNGEIVQMNLPPRFSQIVAKEFEDNSIENLKLIDTPQVSKHSLLFIEPQLLLEHIQKLSFRKETIYYPKPRAVG